jgi:hypothetical protein
MKSTLAIAAMATTSILVVSSGTAHANRLRTQACSIAEPGHPPLHVKECQINTNMSGQGQARYEVTTPDGKRFRIANDLHDIIKWWLNGRPAEQTEGGRCYESSSVAVCVEDGIF